MPIHRNGTQGPNEYADTTLASKCTKHGLIYESEMFLNNAYETMIGEKMPYTQLVSKCLSQYALPGAD
jgi:hypothetical protein